MTLEQLKEHIKQHLDSYGEGHISDDDLPDSFKLVEEGTWEQDYKTQSKDDIYSDGEGNHFVISNTRSGSYHTDWYYTAPHIQQVEPKVETITRVVWKGV